MVYHIMSTSMSLYTCMCLSETLIGCHGADHTADNLRGEKLPKEQVANELHVTAHAVLSSSYQL